MRIVTWKTDAATSTSTSAWETLLPPVRGTLPGGAPLRRTDPGGSSEAHVVLLGVYPALTKQRAFTVDSVRMNLPVEVEAESFDPRSQSGAEIDREYLRPVGLTRRDVFITDLVPYYLANVTKSKSGRSMADNVRLFERDSGMRTGIETRPKGQAFLDYVREMAGNLDRLRDYMSRCRPRLVLTLGTEPAALLRGITFTQASDDVDELLYASPVRLDVFGVDAPVVHLVHPHLFIKGNEKWTAKHRDWCQDAGHEVVAMAME